jgi:surface polysaccharide O-acyltransferase-like enzyme
MVSGAIFALCLRKKVYPDGITFLKKKASRLMIPYVIFGVLIVAPVLMICGLLDPAKAYAFSWNLISGSEVRHLWYLYCLFLIFMLMWLFRGFLVRENVKKVLLISFLVSLAFRSFSPEVLQYFQIANTFYYQFFFVCGVYLDLYFDEIVAYIRGKQKYLWLCLCVLLCSAFADFWTLSGYVYALCGMILSLWVAVLFSRTNVAESPFVKTVSRDSYGIYLFHAMIVYLVFWGFSSVSVPAVVLVLAAFVVSFVVALLLTEVCRRVHLGIVLGERSHRHE